MDAGRSLEKPSAARHPKLMEAQQNEKAWENVNKFNKHRNKN